MNTIFRKRIYLCCSTKRQIYRLPEPVDEKFAQAMCCFGNLVTMDLGDSLLWVVKLDDKMQLRFESGTTKLDARIDKKIYREKIGPLETFLKEYYDAKIELET